jgi:predicted peroxiredoxin
MDTKSVISLSTGLEDAERVTVAFLVAVGSAESGRPTLMFLAKEAVRLALDGFAHSTACAGCPPLEELVRRYSEAEGRYLVCPICFEARNLSADQLVENAALGGTVPMWEWIGDRAANTFSY